MKPVRQLQTVSEFAVALVLYTVPKTEHVAAAVHQEGWTTMLPKKPLPHTLQSEPEKPGLQLQTVLTVAVADRMRAAPVG